jgi:hypothetical protein
LERKNSKDAGCKVKHQTQVVEHKDQICFTKQRLPACPSGCKAAKKSQHTMDVHCRPNHDAAAQHYKKQIRAGANPDLSARPTTQTIKFDLPEQCEKA